MKHNYLLEHENSYDIELEIKRIIEREKFQEVEVHTYDMREVSLGDALEDLDTYGLFSSKKVIVVENLDVLSFDENKDACNHLIKYLDNPKDDQLLFITAKKLNRTRKFTKELLKKIEVVTITFDPISYIKKELDGYQYESSVPFKISEFCLGDLGSIHQECSKLKLYRMDSKKILVSDVLALVVKRLGDSKDSTFQFVRLLAAKQKKEALEKYQELLTYGIDAISLVGLLSSQFLIMYQVKVLEKRGYGKNQIADLLGEKPYRVQKTMEVTSRYTNSELLTIIKKLADIDLKLKSSDVDGNFLIQLFIMENT